MSTFEFDPVAARVTGLLAVVSSAKAELVFGFAIMLPIGALNVPLLAAQAVLVASAAWTVIKAHSAEVMVSCLKFFSPYPSNAPVGLIYMSGNDRIPTPQKHMSKK